MEGVHWEVDAEELASESDAETVTLGGWCCGGTRGGEGYRDRVWHLERHR